MSAAILLEQAIFGLLGKLPYYGCLVQSFKHVITRDVATAGVKFDGNGASVQLAINPDFFTSLTESERIALLIHEASHVDRLHLIRCPAATSNHRLANIAADAAINCYIPGLPAGGIYPKNYRLKNYQTFEFYLARLTDNQDDAKQSKSPNEPGDSDSDDTQSDTGDSDSDAPSPSSANGATEPSKRFVGPEVNSIDSHDWENCSLSTSEQAEIIEKTMLRAIEKMGMDSASLPSHVEETLKHLKELKTRKWHRELRKFLGRTVNGFELERTWARRNRRFGLLEAGSKVSGQKKLAIAFDTSGSMSQTELERCLAETMAMVKSGISVTLIQFDTQVNDIQKLKRSTGEIEVKGRGGTSFTDLMLKVDAMRCDALIVFTDGKDADTCNRPKTPVLWVYTAGMDDKYNWGFKVALDKAA